MDGKRKEIMRELMLRAFQAAGVCGLSLETLVVTLRVCGYRGVPEQEVEADIQYFVDKGLVAEVEKLHSPGNKIWRITAAGTDVLEKRGY